MLSVSTSKGISLVSLDAGLFLLLWGGVGGRERDSCANDGSVNLLSVSWANSTSDDAAYSFADHFIGDFRQAAESLGVLHPFIYINYANKGQDVFSGYGEENKQKLIAIQKDIDPRGVFTSSGLWRGFFKVR